MFSERQSPQNFPSAETEGPFHVHLPFSDLSEWLPSREIYKEAIKAFPLLRLRKIKTLSFLSFNASPPETQYFTEFRHNRLDHTFPVASVTEDILSRNGFPQQGINVGILAGLLHDIATPAHGDTTKLLDLANLREEDFWEEVIGEKGVRFLIQNKVRPETIDRIIKGQGLLGKVLEMADRITYVMQDLSALGVESPQTRLDVYPHEFNSLLLAEPKIGNIYQDICIKEGEKEPFFTNPVRLGTFLHLRAILHKRLYLHPASQGRDLFVANLLRPLYSTVNSSLLTPSKLRRMTDNELMRDLYEYYRSHFPNPDSFFSWLLRWCPSYQKFTTQDEAHQCAQRFSQDKRAVIIGIKESPGFDPATSYKVKTPEGKITPFSKFNPKEAGQIEEIERSTHGLYLFYTDRSKGFPFLPMSGGRA